MSFALILRNYTLYIMLHETDEEAEFVYVRCARVKSFSVSVGRKPSQEIRSSNRTAATNDRQKVESSFKEL